MLNTQLADLDRRYNLQQKYTKIWIAYSGGVDSRVLLELARQYFPNVHAIHINHGTHPDDDLWQSHCTSVCAQLNIPLQCLRVSVQPGLSIESAARNARRSAWAQFLNQDDLLLLAHHADDQAETILYRLLRGTGPRGLTGMQQFSKVGNTDLMRPLLHVSKQEIVDFAQTHNLQWMQDQSNHDNTMDRNYLRNVIMPALQQRWPAANNNINRAGKVCAQMLHCIEPQVQVKLDGMITEELALNLEIFKQTETLWQQECLRAWLRQHDLNPSMQQLRLLCSQVIAARPDAQPTLHIGDKIIKRSQNKLFVVTNAEPIIQPKYSLAWDIRQQLCLPNGIALDAQQVFKQQTLIDKLAQQQVTVRAGLLGRKAKKIFQQHAIPPWERGQYPLVFANDRLVSIVGLWCSPRI